MSTSNTTSVTIPAGYRTYRITFFGYRENGRWGVFFGSSKTGYSYVYGQGMRNSNWFTEEITRANTDKEVFIGAATGDVPSGEEFVTMVMSRSTTSSGIFLATHDATFKGSLTYNTGRSEFTISSPTSPWTMSTDANSGRWIVEAFDE